MTLTCLTPTIFIFVTKCTGFLLLKTKTNIITLLTKKGKNIIAGVKAEYILFGSSYT